MGEASYYVINPGQASISIILLLIALVSVPVMLCVKPCWLNYKHKHDHHHAVEHNPERSGSHASHAAGEGHGTLSASQLEGNVVSHKSNQA